MGTGYTRNDTANNIADGNIINASDFDGEFDAIVTAFSTSGHTHDGTAAEGGAITKLGPAQQLTIAATAITPSTDDAFDLGSSGAEFKDLYIDGVAYIDAINFNGTAIASTAAELNIVDGDTSASTGVTIATSDQFIINDGGTMKQLTFADLETWVESNIDTGASLTTVGALDSGSITSGFGNIDTGSSTITTTGLISGGSLDIDDVLINGTTIGHTDDTDLITLADGVVTVAGELDAVSLDVSGNVDIDGTLEADAITVDGTALNEFIADTIGAMVTSNTETGIAVTYEDGDNTLDFALGAAQTTITSLLATDIKIGEDDQTKIDFETADEIHFYAANVEQVYLGDNIFGPESDSDVDLGSTSVRWKNAYVDSITVTGEVDGASLDISGDADIDGTLEADAITVNGTALATYIRDTVGTNMLSSNTESGIAVTYDTSNDNIDFAIDAAQTTITSVLATDLKIGEDDQTKIDFETADEIHFYAANVEQVYLADNIFGPESDSDVDLGTTGVRWKDAYVDSVTVTDNVTVGGTLTVNGTTTTVNSTTVTIDDPIFTLGGDTAPGTDDNKDRGIEFRYHTGSAAKVGFFGYDDSADAFTFIPDATNSSEVFSGTVGNVAFGTVTYGSLSDGAITVTAFVDEDNMSSDSATLIPTQQSVKAYVDSSMTSAVTASSTTTLTNKTLTAPKFADAGFIADANGNEQVVFQTTSSAVNALEVTNSATGNAIVVGAFGSDSNVDIDITPKGTGEVNIAAGNLNYAGTAITATGAEINLIDGDTARGTTAVASGDGILINDGGTMRMTNVDTVSTYFASHSVGGTNIVTTGALNAGSITSGFGNIDTGSSTITTTGLISGGSLDIDNVLINGTTIGHTDDTDLMTLADGVLTVAGEVSMTTLDIGGTNVTATAAELNYVSGVTSAIQTQLNATVSTGKSIAMALVFG